MLTGRKRYEGLVWLQRLLGDPADGRLSMSGAPRLSIATAISIMGDRYGVIVEVEERDGTYQIRGIPNRFRVPPGPIKVASSYTGTNLSNILSCMVRDYGVMEQNLAEATLVNREIVRLVVP